MALGCSVDVPKEGGMQATSVVDLRRELGAGKLRGVNLFSCPGRSTAW